MTVQEVKTSNWYSALVEEIDAIKVETVYNAQSTLIQGKYEIGAVIAEQKHLGVTELVQYLSIDLKINERDLWYCVKYYQDYDRLKQIEGFDSKVISWNRIKKLLSNPNPKVPCLHKHEVMIKICDDCGAKIKD